MDEALVRFLDLFKTSLGVFCAVAPGCQRDWPRDKRRRLVNSWRGSRWWSPNANWDWVQLALWRRVSSCPSSSNDQLRRMRDTKTANASRLQTAGTSLRWGLAIVPEPIGRTLQRSSTLTK